MGPRRDRRAGRPDEQLVAGHLEGDELCFAALIARYQEPILRLLTGITGDRTMAEDAAQEAFLAAACSLDSLDHPEKFRSWLYRIAYRKGLRLRSQLSRSRTVSLSALTTVAPTSPVERPDSHEPPVRDALRRALSRLSGEDRVLLDMRFIDGVPYAEIARIVGKNAGAVRQRVWVLKRKLLGHLKGIEGAPA